MIPSPQNFTDFIGPAAEVARMFQSRLARPGGADAFKGILWGPPGTGKSKLAELLAAALAGHEISIEHLNGQSTTVDVVREWRAAAPYLPLYGRRKVKWVDEIDKMSDGAQSELLTYLDKLPPHGGFVSTTNRHLNDLQKRLHSRMKQYEVAAPSSEEISTLILRHYTELSPTNAAMIATGSCGDVRAALNDADAYLDRLL